MEGINCLLLSNEAPHLRCSSPPLLPIQLSPGCPFHQNMHWKKDPGRPNYFVGRFHYLREDRRASAAQYNLAGNVFWWSGSPRATSDEALETGERISSPLQVSFNGQPPLSQGVGATAFQGGRQPAREAPFCGLRPKLSGSSRERWEGPVGNTGLWGPSV